MEQFLSAIDRHRDSASGVALVSIILAVIVFDFIKAVVEYRSAKNAGTKDRED